MKHSHRWLALTLVPALLLLAACGGMASSDGRSDQGLAGNWALVEVQHGTLRFSLGDSRPPFTLRLHADGRADGQVACNRWRGVARVSAGWLRLERAAADRAQCRLSDPRIAALERRYLSALRSNNSYRLDGDRLILQNTQGEIWTYQRQ